MRTTSIFVISLLAIGCGDPPGPGGSATDSGTDATSPPVDGSSLDAAVETGSSDSIADATFDAAGYFPNCTEFPSTPAVGTWRDLSKSGFPDTNYSHAFWTGTELLAVKWHESARGLKAYNPTTNSWRTIDIGTTAPTARTAPVLGMIDGKLWLYGGSTGSGSANVWQNSGAILDPTTGTWTNLPAGGPPLDSGGDGAAPHIFGAGDKVIMLSALRGTSGEEPGAILDKASGTWSVLTWTGDWSCLRASIVGTEGTCIGGDRIHRILTSPPGVEDLPATSFRPYTVIRASNRTFAWGGPGFDLGPGTTWEGALFDASTGTWSKTAPTTVPRKLPMVASLDGKVVIWGGTGYDPSKITGSWWRQDGAVYDPVTDTWARMSCAGAPDTMQQVGVVGASELFVIDFGYSFKAFRL